MSAKRLQPGFTLLELILVLVIIGAMLAIVAPSLGRMRTKSRVDDTASQLRSMVERVRARAVSDGRPTRLVIDPAENTCWIEHQEGGGFVRTTASYAKKIQLDTGIQVSAEDPGDGPVGAYTLRAEPDGRVEVLQLRVRGITSGRERVVYARSSTEPYRIGEIDDAAPYAEGGVYAP